MDGPPYEEQVGWLRRQFARAVRKVRWRTKTALGMPCNILVELRWRLGDEIMALPVFDALREAYPGSRIAAWTNYPDIFEGNPNIAAVNQPAGNVDKYILLHSAPRDVYRLQHYAVLAGVPVPGTRPRLYFRDWSTRLLDGIDKPFVAVSAGASWPTKRWPIDRWRALCSALGMPIVELGRDDEQIGAGRSLLNKTTVREAACVLRAAKLFICCDSGLMHLALAAGAPVLALFGPTDPSILVLRNDPAFTIIQSPQECAGCWNRFPDPIEPGACPRNLALCMETLEVKTVFALAKRMLQAT